MPRVRPPAWAAGSANWGPERSRAQPRPAAGSGWVLVVQRSGRSQPAAESGLKTVPVENEGSSGALQCSFAGLSSLWSPTAGFVQAMVDTCAMVERLAFYSGRIQ